MKTVIKTATEARNEFFELIAAAKHAGQETIVVKNGKKVARIMPIRRNKFDLSAYLKNIEELRKCLTEEDFKAMAKVRKEFDRKIPGWS
jgi:prevent-host-death family protein